MILSVKTDNPQAEIAIFDGETKFAEEKWQAHRLLETTLLEKIDQLLTEKKLELKDLTGLITFQGPGSFTGLRIGFAVTNALAASLEIPNTTAQGDSWQQEAIQKLAETDVAQILLPEYGGEANITKPRK